MSDTRNPTAPGEEIERRLVPALKVNPAVLGEDVGDLFAAGVADMDFRAPPPVIEALRRRLDHGVFGYEAVPDGLIPALIGRRAESATITAEPIRLRVPRDSAGFDAMCRNAKLGLTCCEPCIWCRTGSSHVRAHTRGGTS